VAVVAGSFFGTGYAPIASGTVATAAAIPLYLALAFLPPPGSGPWIYLGATLLVALGGVVAAGVMERRLGIDDPSEVVIDEVAGFLVTMLLVPPGLLTITCGFLLFRVFDIVKPWPAGPAERIGGGWGIMADDIVCGIYANLVLQVGIRVLA
jgi:phosphatidylglycerophosphatase A